MTLPLVFMFSGQGSQHYQMGRELFDRHPVFAATMNRLDAVAREFTGESVVSRLYGTQSKAEPLASTALSHPAIFMVEMATANTLIASGLEPDYTLGASLGSYAAACVAGALSEEDALRLAIRQGSTFASTCARGGMIAVLEAPPSPAAAADRGAALAGVNFDTHHVLSAPQAALDGLEAELRSRKAVFQRLPVEYAYHSRWIDEAHALFADVSTAPSRRPSRIPVICCASTQAQQQLPDDFFWQAARAPISFKATIEAFRSRTDARFVDAGPSGTLATLLKYLLPKGSASTVHSVLSPFGSDNDRVSKVLAALRTGDAASSFIAP